MSVCPHPLLAPFYATDNHNHNFPICYPEYRQIRKEDNDPPIFICTTTDVRQDIVPCAAKWETCLFPSVGQRTASLSVSVIINRDSGVFGTVPFTLPRLSGCLYGVRTVFSTVHRRISFDIILKNRPIYLYC